MKRITITCSFLFLFVMVMGMDFSDSIALFQRWVSQDSEWVNPVADAIEDVSLYRKYRLEMIGSIRDDEKYYDIIQLLTLLFDSKKTGNAYEDLAFASYLGYLSATLFNRNFTVSDLNKFPPFYSTYNLFNTNLRDTGISYFSYWIGYGIGLVAAPPDDRFSLTAPSKMLRSRLKLQFSPDDEFFPLLVANFNAETQTRLSDAVERTRREVEKPISDTDLDRLIKRQAQLAGAPTWTNIIPDQTKVAEMFLAKAPKKTEVESVRFLIYLSVLVLLSFWKRNLLPMFGLAILLFEAIFLFFSNGQLFSDIEAFFYGSLLFSLLSFSLILWFSRVFDRKKRGTYEWISLFMLFTVGLLWVIPFWNSPEDLKMDKQEGFYGTAVYPVLKDELFGWKRAYFESTFTDFLSNQQRVDNFVEQFEKKLDHAMIYSGSLLKSDIRSYFETKWTNTRLKPLQTGVMLALEQADQRESRAPDFFLFQSVHGSYALVILSLSTAILIIFKVRKKLFYTIYVLSWLPFFITVFSPTVTLWVEKGFPTISLEVNQPNLFLVITTVIFLSITLLFSIHTFQKEVKKK